MWRSWTNRKRGFGRRLPPCARKNSTARGLKPEINMRLILISGFVQLMSVLDIRWNNDWTLWLSHYAYEPLNFHWFPELRKGLRIFIVQALSWETWASEIRLVIIIKSSEMNGRGETIKIVVLCTPIMCPCAWNVIQTHNFRDREISPLQDVCLLYREKANWEKKHISNISARFTNLMIVPFARSNIAPEWVNERWISAIWPRNRF